MNYANKENHERVPHMSSAGFVGSYQLIKMSDDHGGSQALLSRVLLGFHYVVTSDQT